MTNINDLWKNRLKLLAKEIGKYSRLIFNDHFSVILFVILGFFMFFYREQLVLLKSLNIEQIKLPIIILLAVILPMIASYGRPIWLMKEADKSYVYPLGVQWKNYWVKGSIIGLVLPLFLNIIVSSLLFPFVAYVFNWQSNQLPLWIFMQLLALFTYHLNYYLNIFSLGLSKKWQYNLFYGVWLFVGLLFFNGVFKILTILIFVGGIIFYLYRLISRNNQWIDFEFATEVDVERTNNFYKWMSFFADVPKAGVSVKRRPYFDGLINLLSRGTDNKEYYLYVRLLFRNNNYSGIWIRIMLFISVLLLFTDNLYLVIGLGLIGYYITIVQILPIVHYYDGNPFQQIYPKGSIDPFFAMKRIMLIILLIQTVGFTIASTISIGFNLRLAIVLFVWLLSVIALTYGYLPFWNKKHE